MSDAEQEDVAKEDGIRVRIIDLSGGAEDNIVEEVSGFGDLAQANAFARAYVRDSVERCRASGASGRAALEAWFTFGEDAEVIDGGEDAWRSATELDDFASRPAGAAERDWRALDPRRQGEADPSVSVADDADWQDDEDDLDEDEDEEDEDQHGG